MTILDRARQDVAAGHLWKARERLGSFIASAPTDQAALDLMGEVLYMMRDLPGASRYWQLTERSGRDVAEAQAAFDERYRRSPIEAFRALPRRRATADQYPPIVASRVEARRVAAVDAGFREVERDAVQTASLNNAVVVLVGLLFVGTFVVGFITVVLLIVRAVL